MLISPLDEKKVLTKFPLTVNVLRKSSIKLKISKEHSDSFWGMIYKQFQKNWLGRVAWCVVIALSLVHCMGGFFRLSKPFVVYYDGNWYFPFFRYIFFSGFYTKRLDLFFNVLMFTLPLAVLALKKLPRRAAYITCGGILLAQFVVFFIVAFVGISDPASDPKLAKQRQETIQKRVKICNSDSLFPPKLNEGWDFDLRYMNNYARLNLVLRERQRKRQHERIMRYLNHI